MRFRDNLPEASTGANSYLKLKDKESVVGVFRGEPRDYYAVWKDGKYIEVPEGTPGSKFRFRINFVIKEGASYVPKIFEQGQLVYETLATLHGEYNLERTVCKITRLGEKLDTTYQIMPMRQPVTDEAHNAMGFVKLHDLKGKADEGPQWMGAPLPENSEPYQSADEIPF